MPFVVLAAPRRLDSHLLFFGRLLTASPDNFISVAPPVFVFVFVLTWSPFAVPSSNTIFFHDQVCALAPVGCLLQADGCDWTGTRTQRRGHLEVCPMWQVKCPMCCRSVHVKGGSSVRSIGLGGEMQLKVM